MKKNIIPVESVQERDIDLLLLEELSTNDDFCHWLVNQLSLPKYTNRVGVWKSISDFGLGETDILFSYFSENQEIYLLIENKLDAPFQAEQYERYEKRANKYVLQRQCAAAYCILIAPEKYCQAQLKFSYLTYEVVGDWLLKRADNRSKFKSKIFEIAVEKQRRGSQLSAFCAEYWQHFSSHRDMAKYKVPKNSTASNHAQFYPSELSNFTVYHLFEKGRVSISAKKKKLDSQQIEQLLSLDYISAKATKSKISLFFSVPVVDTAQSLDREVINAIFLAINEYIYKIRSSLEQNIEDKA
jgi:hypothetical protein